MMIVSKQNLRALTKEMFLNLMNEKGLAALEIIRNFNKKERETMTRNDKATENS
jgi:CRP-like cAMP-binding protein